MRFKKTFYKPIVLILSLSFFLFAFVNLSTSPTPREGEMTLSDIPLASAKCGRTCKRDKWANALWNSMKNQRTQNQNMTTDQTTNTENPIQHFGGKIIVSIPCICNAHFAFVIDPVKGPTGPYVISWVYDWALKKWYSVAPGNWVLGTASSKGYKTCNILTPWGCKEIDAEYQVPGPPLGPGMGTSLTP